MNAKTIILGALALGLSAGCATYKLEPPAGFAEVTKTRSGTRLKASDNVGLSVATFANVPGGQLSLWSEDLVRKLARRGYRLEHQTPIESKNGVGGTRFDFAYEPVGTEVPVEKFYSLALFVSDKHRVVLQVAGDASFGDRYRVRLSEIAGQTIVRGCRPASKVCNGQQPPKFAVPPAKPQTGPQTTVPQTEIASPPPVDHRSRPNEVGARHGHSALQPTRSVLSPA